MGANNNRTMVSKYKRSSFNQLDGAPAYEPTTPIPSEVGKIGLKTGQLI